jgi:hypothetical protein
MVRNLRQPEKCKGCPRGGGKCVTEKH